MYEYSESAELCEADRGRQLGSLALEDSLKIHAIHAKQLEARGADLPASIRLREDETAPKEDETSQIPLL